MEEILDTYKLPYNEELPVVCMDEKPYQLPDQVLRPLQMEPGSIRKEDAGYKRKGTVDWQFITENARINLKSLYPKTVIS